MVPVRPVQIRLSTLSIVLGLLVVLPNAYGLLRPTAFAGVVRNFPRNTIIGWPLMLLATAWFLFNVSQESVADFANIKVAFYVLFGAVGLGACIFVRDFLPVRGLAVIFLLLAKLMVDTARWADTDWRLVISIWAYLLAFGGMWFTISPWRLRDIINWATANEQRVRIGSAARLGFGLLVLVLGIAVFRPLENGQSPTAPTAASQVMPSSAPIV